MLNKDETLKANYGFDALIWIADYYQKSITKG